jgi:hypothetical protein
MSQQHQFESTAQEQNETYQGIAPAPNEPGPHYQEDDSQESDETYQGVASAPHVAESAYQEPQKISVSFDSRFMAALLSKIILLLVAGLNLVIARQSIPLLFFGYISRYEALLLLLQGLFPLVIAAVLGLAVFWLNLLVGRRFNANVTRDGKLTLTRSFSLMQRMALEFFSILTVITLLLDVYLYLHYSTLYNYAFGIVGFLLAFCSTLTAVLLCGLSVLVSWLSYLRRR